MTGTDRICAFFLREAARCPGLEIRDLCKGAYQAVLGCEHLLPPGPRALAEAEAAIRAEAAGTQGDACPAPGGAERLPGPWGRAHLSLLQEGLSPRTLAAAFLASARMPRGRREDLPAYLSVLTEMAAEGALPFSPAAAKKETAAWQAAGFPPCRHSEAYRRTCRPAYRVLHGRYLRLLPLLKVLDALLERQERVLLAVEGPCGSGKTTLAADLAGLYDAAVFHADDFFLRPGQRTQRRLAQPGGNLDRERLAREVLAPLRRGAAAVAFRRYDCRADALSPPVTAASRPLNVVEGTYSLHPDLAGYYDASVFLALSPETQRRRIAKRPGAAAFFQRWIPLEETYFQAAGTRGRCTLCLEEDVEGDRDG